MLASDDDTARLVFADFLQENGYEPYADFIRHQVGLRNPATAADQKRMERLARKLLRENSEIWGFSRKSVGRVVSYKDFALGFLRLRLSARQLRENRGLLTNSPFARVLEVYGLRNSADLRAFLKAMTSRPFVGALWLDESDNYPFTPTDVATIAESSLASQLSQLSLRDHRERYEQEGYHIPAEDYVPTPGFLAALHGDHSNLTNLAELDISGIDYSPTELREMFRSPRLAKLRRLRLNAGRHGWSSRPYHFTNLDDTFATPEDAGLLNLESLELEGTTGISGLDVDQRSAPTRGFVKSLAQGPFEKLKGISFENIEITGAQVAKILNARGNQFRETSEWAFQYTNFSDGFFRETLGSRSKIRFARDVSINFSNLPGRDLKTLAESPNHPFVQKVESLSLSRNPIGNEGAEFLSKVKFKALSSLDLSYTKLMGEGLADLVGEGSQLYTWPIRDLDLSGNFLGNNGVEALLAATPRLRALKTIDLHRSLRGISRTNTNLIRAWVLEMADTTKVILDWEQFH